MGKDIRLKELRKAYDAVLLAYGASVDRHMNIEGEVCARLIVDNIALSRINLVLSRLRIWSPGTMVTPV